VLGTIFNIIRAGASVVSALSRFRKNEKPSEPPFVVVPIQQLASQLPSPLKVIPTKVNRPFRSKDDAGLYLLLGGAGVGKTREAADLAERIAALTGTTTVYLARGYVDASVPLPARSDIRRITVVLDDYDYGFAHAAASSFAERQAGYARALFNLGKLFARLKSSIDLHACIVTVNTHRLPITSSDITEILPECSCISISAVNPEEFREFVNSTAKALKLQISEDAFEILVQNCDGRFDTIATFLSTLNSGSAIGKADVEKYAEIRFAAWKLFRARLSNQQQIVYDQVQILKHFKLRPRIQLVEALVKARGQNIIRSDVQRIAETIWLVSDGEVIVYDGQIGPLESSDLDPAPVANAILASGSLRFKYRYAFQEEAKSFGYFWVKTHAQQEQIAFFKRMRKWYPRDRYFAYLYAVSHATQGHNFRAVYALYRVLNSVDIRVVYSGKWVEVQCHLLLAELYQKKREREARDWQFQRRIEREFELAIGLCDIGIPDFRPSDFELVYSSRPKVEADKELESEHKELGFEIPSGATLDSQRLSGMVHHRYASFLVSQVHREFDVLKHEAIASKLIPGFGDAPLYCAMACNQIGDSRKALEFIEQARRVEPAYFTPAEFQFMLSHTAANALAGLGDVAEARRLLQECIVMTRSGKHPDDPSRLITLEHQLAHSGYWQNISTLMTLRTKSFSPNLQYDIHNLNLSLKFPPEWKIDKEIADGDASRFSLTAVFSSQIKWDVRGQAPLDGSITLSCSNLESEMSLKADSLALRSFEKQKNGTIEWHFDEKFTSLDKNVMTIVRIIVKQAWPKQGILVAVALPNCRVQLLLLWEKSGTRVLKLPLEAIAKDFVEQVQKQLEK
jgi:tetratricopeptide (TPR) repeat protein